MTRAYIHLSAMLSIVHRLTWCQWVLVPWRDPVKGVRGIALVPIPVARSTLFPWQVVPLKNNASCVARVLEDADVLYYNTDNSGR